MTTTARRGSRVADRIGPSSQASVEDLRGGPDARGPPARGPKVARTLAALDALALRCVEDETARLEQVEERLQKPDQPTVGFASATARSRAGTLRAKSASTTASSASAASKRDFTESVRAGRQKPGR